MGPGPHARLLSGLRDPLNRTGRAHEIQVSVRACLNVRHDAEVCAEEDLFAFSHEIVNRQVVGDVVLETVVVELESVAPSPRAVPSMKPKAAGGTTLFQLNSGS